VFDRFDYPRPICRSIALRYTQDGGIEQNFVRSTEIASSLQMAGRRWIANAAPHRFAFLVSPAMRTE
jgi:hypothetical protein